MKISISLNVAHLVVIHLEAGVDAVPGEPHHMVFAIIHPDTRVLHNNVLLAQVIHHHHIAFNLEKYNSRQMDKLTVICMTNMITDRFWPLYFN